MKLVGINQTEINVTLGVEECLRLAQACNAAGISVRGLDLPDEHYGTLTEAADETRLSQMFETLATAFEAAGLASRALNAAATPPREASVAPPSAGPASRESSVEVPPATREPELGEPGRPAAREPEFVEAARHPAREEAVAAQAAAAPAAVPGLLEESEEVEIVRVGAGGALLYVPRGLLVQLENACKLALSQQLLNDPDDPDTDLENANPEDLSALAQVLDDAWTCSWICAVTTSRDEARRFYKVLMTYPEGGRYAPVIALLADAAGL
jgi:hypothetical protein